MEENGIQREMRWEYSAERADRDERADGPKEWKVKREVFILPGLTHES